MFGGVEGTLRAHFVLLRRGDTLVVLAVLRVDFTAEADLDAEETVQFARRAVARLAVLPGDETNHR
jgi:hypothetical protein